MMTVAWLAGLFEKTLVECHWSMDRRVWSTESSTSSSSSFLSESFFLQRLRMFSGTFSRSRNRGTVTEKVEPTFRSEVTPTLPPSISAFVLKGQKRVRRFPF